MPQEEVEKIKKTLLAAFKLADSPRAGAKTSPEADRKPDSEAEASDSKPEAEEQKEEKKEKASSLTELLRARTAVMALVKKQLDKPFDVSLNGVESGEIEAVVKARWQYDQVILHEYSSMANQNPSTTFSYQ